MVLLSNWRADRLKVIAVIFYITYLLPYVMVAYYERYALPPDRTPGRCSVTGDGKRFVRVGPGFEDRSR